MIPDYLRKKFPKNACCHVFQINWDGRMVTDVVCSNEKTIEKCSIKIKILNSSLYQRCFKEGLKQALEILGKKGLDLKG